MSYFHDILDELEMEAENDEVVDGEEKVREPVSVWLEDGTVEVDFEAIFWGDVDYPEQKDFVFGSDSRYQLFLGGRGCGKTWALMLKALWLAILNPGLEGAVFGRTLTKDIATKLWKNFAAHMATFKRATGITLLQSHDKASWTTTLRNGSVIHWLSYGRIDQLEQSRGGDYAWAVMDESENSQVDPGYAMETIDDAIRAPGAIAQILAVATTPNGLRGAVGKFVRAQSRGDEDYFTVHATSYNNPHVDPEQIAKRERGRSTRQAAQELRAVVLRPANVVLREFTKGRHFKPYTVVEGRLWVVGIDWGTTKGHMVAAQVTDKGVWWVFDEKRTDNMTRPQFRQAVNEFIEKNWKRIGSPPHFIGADRAVKSENDWLRGRYAAHCTGGIGLCDSREEQKVLTGVGYMQYMLDPADKSGVRLFFSDELTQTLDPDTSGIIGGVMQYRYREIMVDGVKQVTNSPLKDMVNDDPVDSLRYPITMSRLIPELHGGDVLPCVRADSYILAA